MYYINEATLPTLVLKLKSGETKPNQLSGMPLCYSSAFEKNLVLEILCRYETATDIDVHTGGERSAYHNQNYHQT